LNPNLKEVATMQNVKLNFRTAQEILSKLNVKDFSMSTSLDDIVSHLMIL